MHPELGETLNIDGRPLVRLDNAKDVLGKKDKRIAELEAERDTLLLAAKNVVDVIDEATYPDDLDMCDIRGTLSRAIDETEGREVSDE